MTDRNYDSERNMFFVLLFQFAFQFSLSNNERRNRKGRWKDLSFKAWEIIKSNNLVFFFVPSFSGVLFETFLDRFEFRNTKKKSRAENF